MMDIGAPELLLVLIVVLVVFGPTRLPKLARSIGEAIHHFRESSATHDETTTNEPSGPDPNDDAA